MAFPADFAELEHLLADNFPNEPTKEQTTSFARTFFQAANDLRRQGCDEARLVSYLDKAYEKIVDYYPPELNPKPEWAGECFAIAARRYLEDSALKTLLSHPPRRPADRPPQTTTPHSAVVGSRDQRPPATPASHKQIPTRQLLPSPLSDRTPRKRTGRSAKLIITPLPSNGPPVTPVLGGRSTSSATQGPSAMILGEVTTSEGNVSPRRDVASRGLASGDIIPDSPASSRPFSIDADALLSPFATRECAGRNDERTVLQIPSAADATNVPPRQGDYIDALAQRREAIEAELFVLNQRRTHLLERERAAASGDGAP